MLQWNYETKNNEHKNIKWEVCLSLAKKETPNQTYKQEINCLSRSLDVTAKNWNVSHTLTLKGPITIAAEDIFK